MKKKNFLTVLIMVVAALLLSGCRTSRNNSRVRDTVYYGYDTEDSYYAAEEMDFVYEEAAVTNSKAIPESPDNEMGSQKRMIRKSASINIQVMDPLDAAAKLVALTEQSGGFVVSSSQSQETYSGNIILPKVSLTVRVPSEQLNDTLAFIENLTEDSGKYVSNKRIYGVDITSDYVDTNSRLTSLEKTLDKLYEILDTAENAEEALEVYTHIADVESDIEVQKGQIKYMEESVALSSIDVQITSIRPAPIQTVSAWSVGDVIRDAFESLLDGGKAVIEFLIYFIIVVIPIIILIALPIILIVFIIRRVIRSKKEKSVKNGTQEKSEDVLAEVKKE